jgi:hypothetical protein
MQTLKADPAIATHVRRLGGRVIAKEIRNRVVSRSTEVGLRCDLSDLPPLPKAAVPLTLEPCLGPFDGFAEELERTTGADYGRVLRRLRLHEVGVKTLHVARNDHGHPMYVQWLITPEDRAELDAVAADFWPPLQPGEVLLEFAYTFTPFRGLGVMGEAMGRLLRVAADQGATTAYTYVAVDNIPSLRGCAKVGFTLDHMRDTSVRIGLRRSHVRACEPSEQNEWREATAPRS